MNCLKCGAETPEDQVFCDHCLSVMEQYPVKPGTHIHLPKRPASSEPAKKPGKKKRSLSLEEQNALLRSKVLRLRLLAVILAFVICVVGSFLALSLYQQYSDPATGRNYTIDVTMND